MASPPRSSFKGVMTNLAAKVATDAVQTPVKQRTEKWRQASQAEDPQDDDEALAQAATGLSVNDAPAGSSGRAQRAKAPTATKTSEARTLNLWADRTTKAGVLRLGVPVYTGWSEKNPRSNKYTTFYTYRTAFQFLATKPVLWNWEFLSLPKGPDGNPQPPAPAAGFIFTKAEYATEHIFEIQILSQFILSISQIPAPAGSAPNTAPKPILAVQKLLKPAAFLITAQGIVSYNTRPGPGEQLSPLRILASALPAKPEEFVYLRQELNTIKATYFGGSTPDALKPRRFDITGKTDADVLEYVEEILTKIALTAMLARYMNTSYISNVYLVVRGRIDQVLADLEKADAGMRGLGLAAKWKEWHGSFILKVEKNMQTAIETGLAAVEAIIVQVEKRKAGTAAQPANTSTRPVRNKAQQEAASRQWLETEMVALRRTVEVQKGAWNLESVNLQELIKVTSEAPVRFEDLEKVAVFDEKDWGEYVDEEAELREEEAEEDDGGEWNDDSMVAEKSFDQS